MLTSDDIDVTDCKMVNEDCMYVTYRYHKGFEKRSPNTNADVAAYVTTHARLELYSYLEKLKRRVNYYDTDSIIYKSHHGAYEPNIGDQIGSMTDELSCQFIVEFVSNGAKTYGYRTSEGQEVIKCKGFNLNKLTSDTINLDVMRDIATSDQELSIYVTHDVIRSEHKHRSVYTRPDTKIYKRTFDKRVIQPDHTSIPYGYRLVNLKWNTQEHTILCVM